MKKVISVVITTVMLFSGCTAKPAAPAGEPLDPVSVSNEAGQPSTEAPAGDVAGDKYNSAITGSIEAINRRYIEDALIDEAYPCNITIDDSYIHRKYRSMTDIETLKKAFGERFPDLEVKDYGTVFSGETQNGFLIIHLEEDWDNGNKTKVEVTLNLKDKKGLINEYVSSGERLPYLSPIFLENILSGDVWSITIIDDPQNRYGVCNVVEVAYKNDNYQTLVEMVDKDGGWVKLKDKHEEVYNYQKTADGYLFDCALMTMEHNKAINVTRTAEK